MKRRIGLWLIAALMFVVSGFAGCATLPPSIDPAATGLLDAEVAIVSLSTEAYVQELQREADFSDVFPERGHHDRWWSSFRLRPGRYRIRYAYGQVAWGWSIASRLDNIELEAGHRYRIKGYTCPGLLFNPFMWPRCWGRSATGGFGKARTAWIEDERTGEVLSGEKW